MVALDEALAAIAGPGLEIEPTDSALKRAPLLERFLLVAGDESGVALTAVVTHLKHPALLGR